MLELVTQKIEGGRLTLDRDYQVVESRGRLLRVRGPRGAVYAVHHWPRMTVAGAPGLPVFSLSRVRGARMRHRYFTLRGGAFEELGA